MRMLFFILCVIGLALGIVIYKKFQRKTVMQGQLIIIDGASSSGKTSVIKELMPLLCSSYQYVAVDDFVSEIFVEHQKKPLSEKEFLARVIERCDLMYAKIRELIAQGKNVILDTVLTGLEGEKSVRDTLAKLEGLSRNIVLVYCPLPVLVERIKKRNEQASRENKPHEIRSMFLPISQFGHIYRPIKDNGEPVLGKLTRADVERACAATEKEFTGDTEKFEQFKQHLFSQLGVAEREEVTLTTRLSYDLIVDTSVLSPSEAAHSIKQKIQRQQFQFDKKFVRVSNAIELYTESFGESKNQAIVLVSGAMAPARFWIDEFCQPLADAGYFVIRYDHRDMGLSSAIDYAQHPYILDDLAKDAVAILDAYGIKKAHIVGHSMGGAIAQLLALDYPERVSSIVLISSSVLTSANLLNTQEKTSLEKTWAVLGRNKPTKNFAESVDGFMRSYEFLHGDIPLDKDSAQAYIRDMYERSKPEHIAWFERYSSGIDPLHSHVKAQQNIPDRTQELKKITIPVLILHGEKDVLVFPRIMRDYCAKIIPHVKMEIVPNMGHMILSQMLFALIKELVLKMFSFKN